MGGLTMKILNISAECYPFVKVGGLADVVGSLPSEIKRMSKDEIRVMIPRYQSINKKYQKKMTHLAHFTTELGEQKDVYVGIDTLKLGNIRYYFIDNQFYFGSRKQVYGYLDESTRYAYFQKAALESIAYLDFMPQIIHVHDWHTAMIPLLVKTKYSNLSSIKTVLSIHNLAYQGIFPINDYHLFNMEYDGRFEYEGFLNFLKSGIVCADKLSTVSKTYADEIMTDYFGYGMQKLLKARKNDLVGILNGISYTEFDPANDTILPVPFTIDNVKEGKSAAKKALFEKLGVSFPLDRPMVSIISRLVSQKGLDLIQRVFHEILGSEDFSFVVLGDGDKQYVDYFNQLQYTFPGKVAVYIGYSNDLAHLIYAASDFFLMPSKFEPCGLGQMIALRYGTLPIVRETGGLLDSVQPFNEYEQKGNGFSFTQFNAHDMMYVIRYALHVTQHNKETKSILVQHAMSSDFSWTRSAKEYRNMYKSMLLKGR